MFIRCFNSECKAWPAETYFVNGPVNLLSNLAISLPFFFSYSSAFSFSSPFNPDIPLTFPTNYFAFLSTISFLLFSPNSSINI